MKQKTKELLENITMTVVAIVAAVVLLVIMFFPTEAKAFEVDHMMMETTKVVCLDSIYVDENMLEI